VHDESERKLFCTGPRLPKNAATGVRSKASTAIDMTNMFNSLIAGYEIEGLTTRCNEEAGSTAKLSRLISLLQWPIEIEVTNSMTRDRNNDDSRLLTLYRYVVS
jgi:hypothetical protein